MSTGGIRHYIGVALQFLVLVFLPLMVIWQLNFGFPLIYMPALLLAWVVIVAMLHLPVSLVGIEPFDAWVFRIAGWATLSVAAVGLIASLFVPMAYCRFGCPTGAMLGFLRFNARSDHWSPRDWFALLLGTVASGLYLAS